MVEPRAGSPREPGSALVSFVVLNFQTFSLSTLGFKGLVIQWIKWSSQLAQKFTARHGLFQNSSRIDFYFQSVVVGLKSRFIT